VRIRFARDICLHRGVYIDEGVYLHACPNGIEIGDNTYVMHYSELHVYNFRNLPCSGIRIGKNCLISEFNVLLDKAESLSATMFTRLPRSDSRRQSRLC
jgi:carbonic anhydrase/acetyltransferase-like protein (isoleucine patch superfamily)